VPKLPNIFGRKKAPELEQLALEATANMGGAIEMCAPVDLIEAAAAKDGESQGPPTFDAAAYTGASMRISGWRHPVILDLNGIKAAGDQVPVLRGHNDDRVVGHTTNIEVNAQTGVRVKGVISGVGADAKEVVANAKNGFRWQISNGSNPVPGTVEHLPAGKTAIVNGRAITGPHSIVRQSIISEVSFLPRGADNKTSAAIAAQFQGDSAMSFEQWLASKKIEASAVTDTTRAIFEAQWKAEVEAAAEDAANKGGGAGNGDGKGIQASAGNATVDIEAIVAKAVTAATEKVTTELQAAASHKEELTAICAGHSDILAKAIGGKWSADKTKLAVIEASMDYGPYIAASGEAKDAPNQAMVIEASLMASSGADEAELKAAKYDDKVIEVALSKDWRGFGMHALMHRCIRAAGHGHHVHAGMVNDAFIRAAFQADQRINASGSALSTYSLTGVTGNLANKYVVSGFRSVEQSWRAISSKASPKNFHKMTTFRLGGDFQYKKLPPGGEIEHATMVEGSYENQLETWARMFAVDRTTLINDDMDVIRQTFRLMLGRGAGLALVFNFYLGFLDNSTFFTEPKGNLIEADLDIDGLSLVEQTFMGLTDENGDPINTIEGALLLHPLSMKTDADNLYTQTSFEAPSATNPYFRRNPHANKYRPVPSFYLNDPRIAGSDPDTYYVIGNPQALGVGVAQMSFLNGKETPTIDNAELDFQKLGIQTRGVLDFGFALQEEMMAVKVVAPS